jgi:Flp pilus assembly pilin Flp
MYSLMGRVHHELAWLRQEHGQGTVEYVGLILLIAGVLAAVVAASGSFNGKSIGQTIVNELKSAIDGVGKKGP